MRQPHGRQLTAGLLVKITAAIVFATSHCGAATDRNNEYHIQDHFREEHFLAIEVAPKGPYVAIQRERPALPGEYYGADAPFSGYSFSRRSDIWIVNAETGSVVWKTEGKSKRETNFSAQWAPDGKRLALLRSNPSGLVSPVVLDLNSLQEQQFRAIDVDLSIVFTGGVALRHGKQIQFLWSDSNTLLLVSRGSLSPDPLGLKGATRISSQWRAAWDGKVAARVWNSLDAGICDRGAKLLELSTRTGATRQLFSGDLVGISMSASGGSIAVVTARNNRLRVSDSTLELPASIRFANRNDLLDWKVSIANRKSLGQMEFKELASGKGAVSNAVLPKWSDDGNRIGVILGNDAQRSGPPTAVLFDLAHRGRKQVVVQTVQDAEELTAIYAATGVDDLSRFDWNSRPVSIFGSTSKGDAVVAALPANQAVTEDARGIKLVRANGWSQIGPAGSSLRHATSNGIYAADANGVLVVWDGQSHLTHKENRRLPPDSTLAGILDDGDIVSYADTDAGSFVWITGAQGPPRALAKANEFASSLSKQEYTQVSYQVGNENRVGLLLLPRRHSRAAVPVVVTGYPSVSPLVNRLFTRPIGGVAWRWWPVLEAGIAVFVVDFREPSTLSGAGKTINPQKIVMDEIMPAITSLRNVADIDSRRLGFAGYSLGGYTALALLARTDIFRAISAEVPTANLSENLSSIPEVRRDDCAPVINISGVQELEESDGFFRLGAPVYRKWQEAYSYSPLFHLEGATTPTLLISAEFDSYAPSAEQVYMTLLRKGVPTELVTYWGENHSIRGPGNQQDLVARELEWFSRYLKP